HFAAPRSGADAARRPARRRRRAAGRGAALRLEVPSGLEPGARCEGGVDYRYVRARVQDEIARRPAVDRDGQPHVMRPVVERKMRAARGLEPRHGGRPGRRGGGGGPLGGGGGGNPPPPPLPLPFLLPSPHLPPPPS